MTLGEGKTAKIENDLLLRSKEERGKFFDTLQSVLTDFLDEEGEDIKQAIIKTDYYTAAVWRQDGVFYLYDPKGRDKKGMTIGREHWSAKVYPPEEVGEQEGGKGEDFDGMYLIRVDAFDQCFLMLGQTPQEGRLIIKGGYSKLLRNFLRKFIFRLIVRAIIKS